MEQIDSRRNFTLEKIEDLKRSLGDSEGLLKGKACVYATGSFGRLEAGAHSDLDVFIVGLDKKNSSGTITGSTLSNLDSICARADLIRSARDMRFPDFDGDGKYLDHYSVHDLVRNLGKPNDDAENTLTGRLLLFLESKPLVGEDVYRDVIDQVIKEYWRDYSDHEKNFIPAFLTNDILRLWRTFCVNYEARTNSDSDEKKIKRKIKNFKLKHSRMLTCYSALLYLSGILRDKKTVSSNDAKEMSLLTPTERLVRLKDDSNLKASHSLLEDLLRQYNSFLETTKEGDEQLREKFSDKSEGDELMKLSYKFGETMYNTLISFGTNSTSDAETKFCRLMLV